MERHGAHDNPAAALHCTGADSIAFYRALGFELRAQQTKPLLCIWRSRLAGIDLHFKERRAGTSTPPTNLSGGCLVMVDEVASHHAAFTAGLRADYGRLPVSGAPENQAVAARARADSACTTRRATAWCFIRRDEASITYGGSRLLSGLAKALDNVAIFRDFKER